tara:strand:- start:761 stop:955 length:195 start_codon:yes stop_codon:yes gene_type:complete
MKLQKDESNPTYVSENVQFNVVVPKDLREEFQSACDFRRISQRQQLIFLMQDYIDEIHLEREKI